MHDESVDYGLYLRRWLDQPGNSQRDLAKRVPCSPAYLIKIKNCEGIPDDGIAEGIDRAIGAGGQFHRAVQIARQQRAIGRNPVTATVTGSGSEVEVSPTDRRQALAFGGLIIGGLAAGPASAVERTRRMVAANPDPFTLDQLEAGVRQIAAVYTATPYAALEPQVHAAWDTVEHLLDTRVSRSVRDRATLLAGQYGFYLAHLRFDQGDDLGASGYLGLAEQHAAESGEPVLTGSLAALRSSLAYWNGDYVTAANLAAAARQRPHPYTRGMLATLEARAASTGSDPDRARRTLAEVQENIWDGELQPGRVPVYEWSAEGSTAAVLSRLGNGDAAEAYARRSLTRHQAAGHRYEPLASAHNTLSRTLVCRPSPEPEEAAAVTSQALMAIGERPHRAVVQTSAHLWSGMNARWPDLPAVRDLGEAVQAARKALPAGPTA